MAHEDCEALERMGAMPDHRAATAKLNEEDELSQVHILDDWSMPTQGNGQPVKVLGQMTSLVWTPDKETKRGGGIVADAPGMGKMVMTTGNTAVSNHRHSGTASPVETPHLVAVPAGLVQKTCDERSLVTGPDYNVFRYGRREGPLGKCNVWPTKALMYNKIDSQGHRQSPRIDPERRSARTATPRKLKISKAESAAPNLEGVSSEAKFGGDPIFETHYPNSRNKLQCAATQKAMNRSAILFDDIVLSQDYTSTYANTEGVEVAYTQNMARMKVKRVRLQFADGEFPYYLKAFRDTEKEINSHSASKMTIGNAFSEMSLEEHDTDLKIAEARPCYYLFHTYMAEIEKKMTDKAACINTIRAADARNLIRPPGEGGHGGAAVRDGRAIIFYEAGANHFSTE
ncbi:hypothetical protein M409DRAFT_19920 [Zasmidium cellare ATCC 36951]|uniref:Uncharacterized protein n=1 Tax=Zasmidium cellare ATCC 36951 TaxID=1080233 RepID=A0A6A6CQZ2_ZASCE|nr:uncharacterized protein M409DRAFT_19920 [Zasmidium cellare ATCC 36951]KAF2169505.1 hypothetical protein M409DRAFT_19920 [Zasmidium cellare ATCC 36951]